MTKEQWLNLQIGDVVEHREGNAFYEITSIHSLRIGLKAKHVRWEGYDDRFHLYRLIRRSTPILFQEQAVKFLKRIKAL